MEKRPLVAAAACWVAGSSVWSLWPAGSGALSALGGLLLLLAGWGLSGPQRSRTAAVCAAALLLSAGERYWTDSRNRSALSALVSSPEGAPASLSGRIASAVEVDGDTSSFRLAVRSAAVSSAAPRHGIAETVLVRIKLKAQAEQIAAARLKRGDAVRIEGRLELPEDAGNFGAFDYRAYLARQRIHCLLAAQGIGSVTAENLPVPLPLLQRPLRYVDAWRSAMSRLADRLYPGGDAGYMKGLIAGMQNDVDPQRYDVFSRLGLTHVLAVSGLHVAVFVFLLLRCASLLRLSRERGLEAAIVLLPVYTAFTGASPSAVRAGLMAMLALYLARRKRLKDGLHLLSAAAMAMVMWDPLVVEDVSFQLSFAVTAGLLLFVPAASAWIPVRPPWLRSALAVAATAQAVSFPLTVYHFHFFHLLSLPANLVLVPFISFVVLPLGMASVILGAVWLPLGALPAALASFGNRLTFGLMDAMDRVNGLRTAWPQPAWQWVLAAYVLMGAFVLWLRHRMAERADARWFRERLAAAIAPGPDETAPPSLLPEATMPLGFSEVTAQLGLPKATTSLCRPDANFLRRRPGKSAALGMLLALLCAGWLVWGMNPIAFDAGGKVMFLDVNQGDSILIRTGSGRHVLIDAGGTAAFRKAGDAWREKRDPYEVGRKLLVPLLAQRGVRALDVLVLTHLDADHIGGAEAVIRNVPVKAIWFNGTVKDAPSAVRLLRLALERHIPVYAVHDGMAWQADGSTRLEVLFPHARPVSAGLLPIRGAQNKESVVLLVTMYGRRFLLPGDLEADGEAAVVRNLPPARQTQPVDVMKAGHHGSKTSTSPSWLSFWRPRETVISVGRNNVYGHPHPAVVSRIAAFGSALFRTDRNGEIQYRVSPSGVLERRAKRTGGGPR